MPTLGKNKIDPTIDRITIILAIELFAMKGLKMTIPTKVNADAISDSNEKNC